ncbi:MAG: undecaprenyl-diphosphate phosphatase [Pseudomonadota bacterium]
MSILQLTIIAIIQGITEWLPISSSGHVLLAADYFGLEARDELMINAMAHLGTLFAVLAYFWRDVGRAIAGGFELVNAPFRQSGLSRDAWLAIFILASMPIGVAGALAHELFFPETLQDGLRSLETVALATIVFGIALWLADVFGKQTRGEADMTVMHAIIIGATQAIAALIPGTSRSGITMTAARALGYSRTEAARFSMLIGAPLLAAGGLYAVLQLADADPDLPGVTTLNDGLIVAGLSFVAGFASIFILMAVVKRMSFLPFVLYRLLLGGVLLIMSPIAGGALAG